MLERRSPTQSFKSPVVSPVPSWRTPCSNYPIIQLSIHTRAGPAQWLSETVATAGLILVVIGTADLKDAAWRVAAWIGAAYWFTASTSFANPAITLARSLTNTMSGILPTDAPGFILAQFCGALAAFAIALLLFPTTKARAR